MLDLGEEGLLLVVGRVRVPAVREAMGWDGMGWDGMGWDGMGWENPRKGDVRGAAAVGQRQPEGGNMQAVLMVLPRSTGLPGVPDLPSAGRVACNAAGKRGWRCLLRVGRTRVVEGEAEVGAGLARVAGAGARRRPGRQHPFHQLHLELRL